MNESNKFSPELGDESLKSDEERKNMLAIILPLAAIAIGKPTSESIESYREFQKPDKSKIISEYKSSDYEKMPKELRRFATRKNMELDAHNIYTGNTTNKKLEKAKNKLIMFDDIKGNVNETMFKYCQAILVKGDKLTGKERNQYASNIINQFEDVYASSMKDKLSVQDREEITACLLATIHEYNSLMKAGSTEDQIKNQTKAGLIGNNAEGMVKHELNNSEIGLTIEDLPKNISINGEDFSIDKKDKLYQHIGNKLVELPMSYYEGTKIENLYDLKKTDPEKYAQFVKENMSELVNDAITQAKILGTNASANDETLRKDMESAILESIKTHDPSTEITLRENKKDIIDLKNIGINGLNFSYQFKDYNLFKIGDQEFNVPGIEIAALFNHERGVNVNCDFQALGGRIDAKMLCEGNMIRIIIPNLKTAIHEKHQKVAINGLALLALLPLLGLRFRSKKSSNKPEGTFLDHTVFPTLESTAVTPEGVKIPLGKPETFRKFLIPENDLKMKNSQIPRVSTQYFKGGESSGGGINKKRSGGRGWSGERNRQK